MSLAGKLLSCCHPVAQKLPSCFPVSSTFPSQAFKDFHSWSQTATPGLVSCHLRHYQPSPHAPSWLTSPLTESRVACLLPLFYQAAHWATVHAHFDWLTDRLTVLLKSICITAPGLENSPSISTFCFSLMHRKRNLQSNWLRKLWLQGLEFEARWAKYETAV